MGFILKQNFPLVGGGAVLNLFHNQGMEVFVSSLHELSCEPQDNSPKLKLLHPDSISVALESNMVYCVPPEVQLPHQMS